jgi:hypothetical protein
MALVMRNGQFWLKRGILATRAFGGDNNDFIKWEASGGCADYIKWQLLHALTMWVAS